MNKLDFIKPLPSATVEGAYQGVTSGLPLYAIMLQSNVIKLMPSPELYPKSLPEEPGISNILRR